MPSRLRKWLALDWRARVRLLAMILALPVIDASLRLWGYQATRSWLEMSAVRNGCRKATAADIEMGKSLATLASIAGRHGVMEATCLRQSLLVYWWLLRVGLAPELQLGVRQTPDQLDAHAWVVLEGHALVNGAVLHKPFLRATRPD